MNINHIPRPCRRAAENIVGRSTPDSAIWRDVVSEAARVASQVAVRELDLDANEAGRIARAVMARYATAQEQHELTRYRVFAAAQRLASNPLARHSYRSPANIGHENRLSADRREWQATLDGADPALAREARAFYGMR